MENWFFSNALFSKVCGMSIWKRLIKYLQILMYNICFYGKLILTGYKILYLKDGRITKASNWICECIFSYPEVLPLERLDEYNDLIIQYMNARLTTTWSWRSATQMRAEFHIFILIYCRLPKITAYRQKHWLQGILSHLCTTSCP